jgi:hypothetical protein
MCVTYLIQHSEIQKTLDIIHNGDLCTKRHYYLYRQCPSDATNLTSRSSFNKSSFILISSSSRRLGPAFELISSFFNCLSSSFDDFLSCIMNNLLLRLVIDSRKLVHTRKSDVYLLLLCFCPLHQGYIFLSIFYIDCINRFIIWNGKSNNAFESVTFITKIESCLRKIDSLWSNI